MAPGLLRTPHHRGIRITSADAGRGQVGGPRELGILHRNQEAGEATMRGGEVGAGRVWKPKDVLSSDLGDAFERLAGMQQGAQ